jgi:hypothetical protein
MFGIFQRISWLTITWIFVLIFILFLFFSILTLQRTRKSSLPKIRVFPFSKSTIGEKSVLWNFCFNFKMCRFNAYFKLLRGENILMETIFPWIRLTVLWGFLMICHEQVKQIEMVWNKKTNFFRCVFINTTKENITTLIEQC